METSQQKRFGRSFLFNVSKHQQSKTIIVLGVIFLTIFSFQYLFTEAETVRFNPKSCLGTWENPSYAEGDPETLYSTSSAPFSNENSASYATPASELFCGNFLPLDYKGEGELQYVSLTFIWHTSSSISKEEVSTEEATSSQEENTSSTPEEENDLPAAPIEESTSTPWEKTEARTPIKLFVRNLFHLVQAEEEGTISEVSESTENPLTQEDTSESPKPATPEPPIDTVPTELKEEEQANIPENNENESEVPLPKEEDVEVSEDIDISVPEESLLNEESTTTSTSLTTEVIINTSTESLIELPLSEEETPFLKVSYAVDGMNWFPLGDVSMKNFRNLTFQVPITNWETVEGLQIRVEGVPNTANTEDKNPVVLLDGIFLEMHYSLPGPLSALLLDAIKIEEESGTTGEEDPSGDIKKCHSIEGKFIIPDHNFYTYTDPEGDTPYTDLGGAEFASGAVVTWGVNNNACALKLESSGTYHVLEVIDKERTLCADNISYEECRTHALQEFVLEAKE